MKESLKKLIKRVLFKKYPWMVDCDIVKSGDDMYERYQHHYYKVNIFADTEIMPPNFPAGKIRTEIENLYLALGPKDDEVLESIDFYRENKASRLREK
jgi:hypothetical protein